MQKASATVVALVGERARRCARALRLEPNVRAVLPEPGAAPLERASAALRAAVGTSVPFIVHDADPLAVVAEAWRRHFDEQASPGDLEVAVSEAVAGWRAGRLELPDFYLLLDVDDWPATRRHFYLGFLHRHAPVRVVPCAGTPEAAGRAISGLRAGRWWPGLDRLLAGVEQAAPGQLLPPDTGTAALATE